MQLSLIADLLHVSHFDLCSLGSTLLCLFMSLVTVWSGCEIVRWAYNHLAARCVCWLCWHGISPGGLYGVWPKAAGMRRVACGAHEPPPAPIQRSRATQGSDTQHRSPDEILGSAEFALSFPIYMPVFLSLFALQTIHHLLVFSIIFSCQQIVIVNCITQPGRCIDYSCTARLMWACWFSIWWPLVGFSLSLTVIAMKTTYLL
jgi:hypothetical protein